jgi:hypothetical protein
MKFQSTSFKFLSSLLFLPLLCFQIGQSANAQSTSIKMTNVQEVASWLSGQMDSSLLAMNDRDFVDVRITHCKVNIADKPLWTNTKSIYLYVEQALSLALKNPYRQRFVRIHKGQNDDEVISAVFKPSIDKRKLIGLCKKDFKERKVLSIDLGKSDCPVTLTKEGNAWVGKTPDTGCPNDFRGASYATSEVKVRKNSLYSWDRGWNNQGEQIWGAVKSGYTFNKFLIGDHDVEINAISQRLSGRYNNFIQAQEREDSYIPISFNNCPVQLVDGLYNSLYKSERVIFMEQKNLDVNRPFNRLSVAVISRSEDTNKLMASFYPLKNPQVFKGICNLDYEQRIVDFRDVLGNGCQMSFTADSGNYVGKTLNGGCDSSYRGASKLVIDTTLYRYKMEILERWYDQDGRLVIGREKDPYIFGLE